MDRRAVIFIICLLVVFGVFAQVGFCNGGGDGDGKKKCPPCKGNPCAGYPYWEDTDELAYSKPRITYYESYPTQTFNPKPYESSKDKYHTCSKSCKCGVWDVKYKTYYSGQWADRDICQYCEGWCMDRPLREVPVFDGPSFSNCGSTSGDCSIFGSKYKKVSISYSEDKGGTCICSWCAIKDYFECDDAFINDSHPCASGNCAPSFEGGRAVCLPDKKCWWDKDRDGKFDSGEDFAPGFYTLNGYNLTCQYGKWFFRLDDNAGETISIELWNNTLNAYPKEWERNQKGVYWGIEQVIVFKLTENRDIVVYTNPKRPKGKKVYIEVYRCQSEYAAYLDDPNWCELAGNGTDMVILENQPWSYGWYAPYTYMVKLRSDVNQPGYRVNVTVDTFLPEAKKVCSGRERECAPLSYCVLDNVNYLLYGSKNYYCCPIGTCYYNGDCYSEGMVLLNVPEEIRKERKPCRWKCENGKFRKLEVGEVCKEDCECRLPGKNDFGCSQVLQNQSKKVCCPVKDGKRGCAIEGKVVACVEDGVAYVNEKDGGLYVCNDGKWEGGLWVLKKVEARILLKEGEIFNTSFSIEKPLVNSTLYIFYDDPLGGSEVRYSVNGNDWDLVPEDMTIKLGSLEKGALNVSVRLEKGSFIFVDGIVLYGER